VFGRRREGARSFNRTCVRAATPPPRGGVPIGSGRGVRVALPLNSERHPTGCQKGVDAHPSQILVANLCQAEGILKMEEKLRVLRTEWADTSTVGRLFGFPVLPLPHLRPWW